MYIIKFTCPTRGFFSIYMEVVRCIDFAIHNGLDYYVDLSESQSLYTDALSQNGNKNIWDYYFKQQLPPENGQIAQYSSSNYEGNTRRIWHRRHFQKVYNNAVKKLEYNESVGEVLYKIKSTFPPQTLGVHIRKTDSYTEVPEVPTKYFINYVRNITAKKKYTHLFIATDDEAILQIFKECFSTLTVICNNVTRSTTGKPVHKNDVENRGFQLGLEALVDTYSLSLCNEVILSSSNLSYCVLYLNPNINYSLLDGFTYQKNNFQKKLEKLKDAKYNIRYLIFNNAVLVNMYRKWKFVKKIVFSFAFKKYI